MQQVKTNQLQRDLLSQLIDLMDATEAPHQLLKRPWATVFVDSKHFAFEDHRRRGKLKRKLHDLRNAAGDIAQAAGKHPHLITHPMDLNSRAVELEFHRG